MPRFYFFIVLFLIATCAVKAQNLQHIKVKKADAPFLFFQKVKNKNLQKVHLKLKN